MNIAKSVESAFDDEQEAVVLPSLEQRQTELTLLLHAIKGLKNNKDYQYFKKNILDDAISVAKERITTEKDRDEILRLQGVIVSSQQFSDLARLESFYQAELEKLKGRIHDEEEKIKEQEQWKKK